MVDVETEERPAASGQPPPPNAPPPLRRRSDLGVISGVAAGVAERLAIDVVWVRAAFIVSCFFGGLGLLAYAALWALLPDASSGRSAVEGVLERRDRITTWVGIGLIVWAGLLALDRIANRFFGGWWYPFDRILDRLGFPLVLVAIGALILWWGQRDPRGPDGAPPSPSFDDRGDHDLDGGDPTPDVEPEEAPTTAAAMEGPEAAPTSAAATAPIATSAWTRAAAWRPARVASPPPPPAPPRPPRERSILGRATVAATFLLVGAAALVAQLFGIDLAAADYIALALATIGGGLVIGAWRGRSRGLVLVGLLLLPPLLLASAVRHLPVGLSDGMGQEYRFIESASQLDPAYELFAGELTLDLSNIRFADDAEHEVDVTVGMGQIRIVVPSGVEVEIDGAVRGGEMQLFDRRQSGWQRTLDVRDVARGEGRLVLHTEVGYGRIEVYRADFEPPPQPEDIEPPPALDATEVPAPPADAPAPPPSEGAGR